MGDKLRHRKPGRLHLVALLLTFILPFAVVVYQLVAEINQRVEFAQYEIYGNGYLRPLEQLLQDVPESQLIAQRYFNQRATPHALKQQQAILDRDIQALATVNNELGDRLHTSTHYEQLQHSWMRLNQELSSQLARSHRSPAKAATMQQIHTQVIADIRALMSQVGDTSNLILDPDLDSYYLMDEVLLTLPEGQDLLAQLRLMGEEIITRQQLQPEEKGRLISLVGLVSANGDTIQKNMSVAFRHNPAQTLASVLTSPTQDAVRSVRSFLTTIEQSIIQSKTVQLSLPEYDQQAIATLQANFTLWQKTIEELDGLLKARIQRFRHKTYMVEAFTLLVLVVVVYVFIAFARNLKAQRRSERRLSAQHSATRALAESTLLHQAAPQLLQAICEGLDWDLGEIWHVEDDAGVLRLVETWWRSSLRGVERYSKQSQQTFTLGTGLPGIIWERGEWVWIADLRNNHDLMRHSLLESGLYAACGFPLCSGDRIVGVLVFFSRTMQKPDTDLLKMMRSIAYQIGQFIERQRTETALRQSEELQRMALNAARMGAWDWNIQTGEEHWSKETERLFGVAPGTFSAKVQDFFQYVHPDDRQRVMDAQRHAIHHGTDYAPEYRIVHPDGSLHWMISQGNVLRDETGEPLRFSGITMDITERKQAEIALAEGERRLRKAEDKYRSIFENAVTGIFQSTPEGRYLSANPAMARILGYASPAELMETLTDIRNQLYVYPEQRHEFVAQMTANGSVSEFESQVYRRDGSVIWISSSAIVVQDDNGDLYYEGTVEDITERKRTEEQIREREERFRSLLSNISGAVYRCAHDVNWTMEFISNPIQEITGYTAEDFIQNKKLTFAEIIPTEDNQLIQQEIDRAIAEKRPYILEYRIRHADGTTRWVYEKGQGIFDSNDELIWLDGVIFDITDRKRTVERLRLLESVVVNTRDSIIITEADPIDLPGPRILYVNPAFTAKTGYTTEEVLGQTPRILQGPNSDRTTLNQIRSALSQWQSIQIELLNYCKDGSEFWSDLTIIPVADETGWYTHWISIQRDITERKQTEETLRRSKEAAEDANRAKSQFLANMSHELRTPLNAIIGYSEMLQEDAEDLGYSDLVPDLEKIRGAGKHLLSLINDILDISKIEAGKMELYLETFDVSQVIFEVENTIQPLIEKNHNTLTVQCASDIGSMYADLTKLRQSLFNLLSNAAKFTQNGTITLTVAQVTLNGENVGRDDVDGESIDRESTDREKGRSSQPSNIPTSNSTDSQSFITFRVTDSGIGMTLDQVHKVFQPFTQADASTTRKYGGTGLGLAITRHFCQMMGGDITVHSTLGEGSTFTIYLPVAAGISKGEMFSRGEMSKGKMVKGEKTEPCNTISDAVSAVSTEDKHAALINAPTVDASTNSLTAPSPDPTFLLPQDPIAPDQPAPDQSAPELTPIAELPAELPTVLVIDDDATVRDLMARYLTREGFRVETAATGDEGLKLAKTLHPDAITLDVLLPHMNGWDVLSALKADAELADIPVVVMSIIDDKNTGFRLGATDYLTKPVDYKRLARLLNQYRPHADEMAISFAGHVLVAEDDPTTREIFRRMLEREGWAVIEAENGRYALEKLAIQLPDLVLLDLMMPEMDGFQFITILRQHPEWRSLPIIVVTAMDLTPNDRLRLNGYVEQILQKGSYNRDDLLREVRDLVLNWVKHHSRNFKTL